MPQPLEDLNRDHQCHFYQAPTGQRCGSPALKGEYYCYHHHLKTANRNNRRILIDPEVTCMEIPPIEDRASIFTALAAVLHRLAENTIDTRRAGQMIYGLQVAMRALEPPPLQRTRFTTAAQPISEPQPAADTSDGASTTGPASDPATGQPATNNLQPATALKTIPITKESLLYFLRSRHCYNCNAELFPAEDLTERRNPGVPPEIIEEAHPALPPPEPQPGEVVIQPDDVVIQPNDVVIQPNDVVILSAAKNPRISPVPPHIDDPAPDNGRITLTAPEPQPNDVVILSAAKNPRISPMPPQTDEPAPDNGRITLNASALDIDDPPSNHVPRTWNLARNGPRNSHARTRFALHSPRRSVS